nr:dienelactone hydrolase family protein [Catenulispora pinisilvae]
MIAAHTNERVLMDAEAYLSFLTAQPEVGAGPVAVTGYCIGGCAGGQGDLLAGGAVGDGDRCRGRADVVQRAGGDLSGAPGEVDGEPAAHADAGDGAGRRPGRR